MKSQESAASGRSFYLFPATFSCCTKTKTGAPFYKSRSPCLHQRTEVSRVNYWEPEMVEITVFQNGSTLNVRISIDYIKTIKKILSTAESIFNQKGYSRLFSSAGVPLTNINQLKPGDVVYISKGEAFIPPLNKDSQLVKLSFGGHLFYTQNSTLTSCEPISMKIKCKKSRVDGNYLRDVSVYNKPKHCPLDQLSDEVFGMILSHLPSKDLRQCRLVNSFWNTIAIRVCGRQHIQVGRPYGYSSKLVTNQNDLPGPTNSTRNASQLYPENHVAAPSVQDLNLSFRNEKIAEILATIDQNPNIEILKIDFSSKDDWNAKDLNGRSVCLLNLKQLELSAGYWDGLDMNRIIPFLEHILQNSRPRLEYFRAHDIKLDELSVESANRLTFLMARFNWVNIFVQCDPSPITLLNVFTAQEIRIQKFSCRLPYPCHNGGNGITETLFAPLEKFLNACSQFLQKLDLIGYMGVAVDQNIAFNFPAEGFPYLKKLAICIFEGNSKKGRHELMPTFLSRLEASHFPVLEKFYLEGCEENSMGDYPKRDNENHDIYILCPRLTFDKVTKLKLNCPYTFHIKDDWSHIFPNLKQLITTVVNSPRSLRLVFKNKRLEYLQLTVLMIEGNGFEDDVNDLLSVTSDDRSSDLSESDSDTDSETPALFGLKRLKSFRLGFEFIWPRRNFGFGLFSNSSDEEYDYLRNEKDRKKICASGLCKTLLKLHPLESLILCGVDIKSKCNEMLHKRHQKYDFYYD